MTEGPSNLGACLAQLGERDGAAEAFARARARAAEERAELERCLAELEPFMRR